MNQIQAEKIDRILTILVDRNKNGSEHSLFPDEISDILKISEKEAADLINNILKEVVLDGNSVVKFETNQFSTAIKINYNTREFINSGGCLAIYSNQVKEAIKRKKREEQDQQKLDNDIASFKITKNQYLWTIGIAIAGFLLALGSLMWQIFHSPS